MLNISPTKAEKRKYVLKEKRDYEILAICKELGGKKLTKIDRELVRFIKTQLEHNWRKPLLKKLKQIEKKYENKK